ncbi:unnamed protein product [Vitrella brassicaformis CCMP3155]|uniref:GP-PDE domain-containing protein n=1 Tax=Vitrella brassicaformis (strain CCMP3155) TaxID=1169540 RepID=A0A0G4EI86_VITBC|nr:unnamed protein product [Vitrella brassicaformis CCMP3155]|eukprot:CEL95591.1 unnamed protein product [Vitrella brassicaformis CCMP3155]
MASSTDAHPWLRPLVVAGGAVATYALISEIFGRYPHLLWGRPDPSDIRQKIFFDAKKARGGRVLCVGHRAGGGEEAENTVSAVNNCVANGAAGCQIDARMTKDGVAVAYHSGLKNLTGADKELKDLNYDDIPPLKKELPPNLLIPHPVKTDGGRLSLLKDVLAALGPDMFAILELWDDDQATVDAVYRELVNSGRKNRTVWGNPFNKSLKEKLMAKDTSVPCITVKPEFLRIVALYTMGLLPFVSIPNNLVYNVPLVNSLIVNLFAKVAEMKGKKVGWWFWAKAYMAKVLINRPGLWRHLERRGVPVVIWILNEEGDWSYAVRHPDGITAIQTDYPKAFSAWMARA